MIIQAFKNWVIRAKAGEVRMRGLFWFSMAECTIVPIPLEVVLFPVMQMNRNRTWRIAFWVTLGALAGSLIFYGLAYLAMETLGARLITLMEWDAQLAQFQALFDRYGFWAIVVAGILPIPLQIAMLTAGAASYSLVLFMLAILVSRTFRYYGVGWLVLRYGDQAKATFDENKTKFAAIALAVVIALWITLTFLLSLISS